MTTWVLLRGLVREARHWGGFAGALAARLPAGDQVVALDLPGNGARCAERSPASVPALAQALAARVPGAGPIVPVAISLGGMVALAWAQCDPRVAGLVLINTSLGGLSPPWQRLRPAAWADVLRAIVAGAGLRERIVLARTSRLHANDAGLARLWAQWARERPVRRANALRQLVAAARYRSVEKPGVPVLLLASAQDGLVSPECSRRIAKAWACPLRLHPQAGHDLPLDDAAWVVAQVTDGAWRTQA